LLTRSSRSKPGRSKARVRASEDEQRRLRKQDSFEKIDKIEAALATLNDKVDKLAASSNDIASMLGQDGQPPGWTERVLSLEVPQ
jgi:hypothetical protein